MQKPFYTHGFTLIELMIAVGVIGIISSIAFPMYSDYIATSRAGIMADNIQSIRLFQEDRKLRLGEYVEGSYDPASPNAAGGIKTTLGWEPRSSVDKITYVIACATDGATAPECARNSGYTVTATHADGGDPVVKTY